jgi:hypothetical protein
VDVLVEFQPGFTPGFALIRMEDELSELFGGRKVDLITPKFLNHRIRDRILSEAVVVLTLPAKRSRGATENPVEAFGGAGQLDGVRKTPQCPSGGHMPTHLAEILQSLSWLRLRPMIDNPGPLDQTQG